MHRVDFVGKTTQSGTEDDAHFGPEIANATADILRRTINLF